MTAMKGKEREKKRNREDKKKRVRTVCRSEKRSGEIRGNRNWSISDNKSHTQKEKRIFIAMLHIHERQNQNVKREELNTELNLTKNRKII